MRSTESWTLIEAGGAAGGTCVCACVRGPEKLRAKMGRALVAVPTVLALIPLSDSGTLPNGTSNKSADKDAS